MKPFVAGSLLALCPSAHAGASTLLVLEGHDDDYIGQGMSRSFAMGDGTFTVFKNSGYPVVQFSFDGAEDWGVHLADANEVPLAVGVYRGAHHSGDPLPLLFAFGN